MIFLLPRSRSGILFESYLQFRQERLCGLMWTGEQMMLAILCMGDKLDAQSLLMHELPLSLFYMHLNFDTNLKYLATSLRLTASRLIPNLVNQRPNLLNLNCDIPPILQHHPQLPKIPYPPPASPSKESPSLQRGPLTQITNLLPNIKDHIPGMPILHRLAIRNGLYGQRLQIGNDLWRNQHGPNGTARVQAPC
jgi:hypothetical protein